MNKILTVIPFSKGDGALAERLVDWIYFLNGKQPRGHCLLVASGDTHAELVTKVQLSAEVAFESVTVFVDKVNPVPSQPKIERVNRMFLSVATFVGANFKWPFLFLPPDCVPLKSQWLETLAESYRAQPKRFMGSFLKYEGEKICLSRVAIYPRNAVADLRQYCTMPGAFNLMAGQILVNMACKSKLFQQLEYRGDGDKAKIRPDAVLLHGDKKGQLIALLRKELKPKPVVNGESVPIRTTERPVRLAATA